MLARDDHRALRLQVKVLLPPQASLALYNALAL